ncbi:unnamed protein product [Durusdinium trenchii]|uniref:Uncharacterized protein n=1 Tax=Durusdinium trenchii TaxID=1381693 RepID=A0ABP0SZT1_9DINO
MQWVFKNTAFSRSVEGDRPLVAKHFWGPRSSPGWCGPGGLAGVVCCHGRFLWHMRHHAQAQRRKRWIHGWANRGEACNSLQLSPTDLEAMAKRISAVQPSGEEVVLEVKPDTRVQELKQQIKERQVWDELTCKTTGVEIVVGDHQFLANDAKVLDAVSPDTTVSVVFRSNAVRCSNQDAITSLGGVIDSELLLAVEIPSDETKISDKAFAGCDTLARVTIPDSVTHIGEFAFAECSSLENLTIPDSVTHIGVCAFAECSSLVSLTIPNSVTHLGDGAFQDCSSLVNLTIPNSVTRIGRGAFMDCSDLASLTIPDTDGLFIQQCRWHRPCVRLL